MQEEDILKHTNVKCHLCTVYLTYKPMCNIGTHLITGVHTHANILVNTLEHQLS